MALWTPGKEVILFNDPRGRSLLNGLVGYWPLDEASGTRRDLSGNGLTLTDNNTVTGAAGPSSKLPLAGQFTAANSEWLSIADNAALSMGAGVRMSGCAWAYKDSSPANNMHVAAQSEGTGDQRAWVLRWNTTSDRYEFAVDSNGSGFDATVTANTFGAPANSAWHFLTWWYDGTNIYLSVNNGAADSAAFSADIFNSSANFDIGATNDTGILLWNGSITGMGLWKRALTAAERAYLYNSGAGRQLIPGRGWI